MSRVEDANRRRMDYNYPKMVLNVPSRKKGGRDYVDLRVRRKDIENAAGMPISNREAINIVTAGVIENAKERIARNREYAAKHQSNSQRKMRLSKRGKIVLSTILIAVGIYLFSPYGPIGRQEVLHTIPINSMIYSVSNPGVALEGLVGLAGQEGMTANSVAQEKISSGKYYDAGEQGKAESKAVGNIVQYEKWREEIQSCIGVLSKKDSSQEDIKNAINRLLEIQTSIKEYYSNNQEFFQEYMDKFRVSSTSARDRITDTEIYGTQLMFDSYMNQMGLSSINIAQLQMMQELMNNGYEIEFEEIVKDPQGNYHIDAEALKIVTKWIFEEGPEDVKISWQKFLNLLNHDNDKNIDGR